MQGEYYTQNVFGGAYKFQYWRNAYEMPVEHGGMTDEQLLSFIRDKRSRDWFIAALIDGSIGYHTYDHAAKIVDRYDAGERKEYCERASLYGYDLVRMFAGDVRRMLYMEEHNLGKVHRLISVIRAMSTVKDDYGKSTMISMAYPTMAI